MKAVILSFFLIAAFVLTGCDSAPPKNPSADAVTWTTYRSASLGFSLEHPKEFEPHESDNGVLFRYRDYPVLAVSVLTRDEADGRGLWADFDPIGDTTFAGRSGKVYRYTHKDALYNMDTWSLVVPHARPGSTNPVFFALEFRTKNDSFDAVQQRIVDSVHLD